MNSLLCLLSALATFLKSWSVPLSSSLWPVLSSPPVFFLLFFFLIRTLVITQSAPGNPPAQDSEHNDICRTPFP